MTSPLPRLLAVVSVSGQRLALPADAVAEIVLEPRLLRPPAAPPVLAGVFVLRGAVIPVAFSHVLLALPPSRPAPFRAVVVLAAAFSSWALLVDRALDVGPCPACAAPEDTAFNDCVSAFAVTDGGVVPVLAPERLLRRREVEALEAFARRAAERGEEFKLGDG